MGVTSGSFNTSAYTGSQNSPRYYTFSWSLINQSIEGNYSDISWSLKGAGGNKDTYWVNVKQKYVTVNGSTQSNETIQQTYNGTVAFSGTARIYHNSDGAKSFSASAGGAFQSYGSYNSTGSGTWELPTIARASQPSCITYPNTTENIGSIGNSITIHMNRKSELFTHTVRYSFGSLSGTIATGVTNNCQWTIPTSFYSQIPNSNTGTGSIYVDTYNGSQLIGTKSVTFRCNVTNSNPTAGTFAYKDNNDFTIAITEDNQRIIRERSNLVFTIGKATAKNSATISKYEITFNDTTKSTTTAGDLNWGNVNLSSNSTAILKVTDSRGNTVTKEITVLIDDWKLPTGIITLNRKNNFYSETYLKVDGTYSSLNGKNSMSIQYQYRKLTEKDFTELYNLEDNTQATLNLDNNYQWHIIVIVGDRIGETTYNLTLDRGMPIVFFDRLKSSAGINCFPTEEKTLQVNGQHLPVAWSEQEVYGFDGVKTEGKLNKSGFYTVCDTSGGGTAWHHLFNLRHRNGFSDGIDYGMQIRKPFGLNSTIQVRSQNAKTWSGWEAIFRTKTLYENSSGTTGTVTLNETVANFSYIEIFYSDNNTIGHKSTKVVSPNNKIVQLSCIEPNDTPRTYIRATRYAISGTNLTVGTSTYTTLYEGGTGVTSSNYIKIIKVIGYR
jgi:hypothetical protein